MTEISFLAAPTPRPRHRSCSSQTVERVIRWPFDAPVSKVGMLTSKLGLLIVISVVIAADAMASHGAFSLFLVDSTTCASFI